MHKKITFIFEKICQMQRNLLWEIARKNGLSPLQVQLLLHIKRSSEKFHRISCLSLEFGITQPTVSDAVATLIEKGYLKKTRDMTDARSYLIELTESGRNLAARKLSSWEVIFQRELRKFSPEESEKIFVFLSELLVKFQESGVMKNLRMCLFCRYFEKNAFPGSKKPHLCRLTKSPLALSDLSVRCEGNEPRDVHELGVERVR